MRDHFFKPMLAKLVERPPSGEWLYEIKFDGYRAMAYKEGKAVRLFSRNQNDLGGQFPEAVDALGKLRCKNAILDGEIVALDEHGRPSFHALQSAHAASERPPICYYAFDLLRLDGNDLCDVPLIERKQFLEKLIGGGSGVLRFSPSLNASFDTLLQKANELRLEGIMAKRPQSLYEPGQRSGAWVKIKLTQEQNFVIGGYTDPSGARLKFGGVLVGYREGKSLRFCASVGSGFNDKLLRSLHARFQTIAQEQCPFVNLPEKKRGRFGQGITASQMRRCHWVKPILKCTVKFSEWTPDMKLRHPVFVGLI